MNNIGFLVLSAIVILLGAMIQSGFGFALALILMAFFPNFLTINESVVINLICCITGCTMMTWKFRKKINWKVLLPVLIPTVIITGVGAYFAVDLDADLMYLGLGFVLVALSIWFFVFSSRIKITAKLYTGILVGIIGGILGALFSLAGPAAALYLMAALDDREEFIATIQMYFLFLNSANLIVRLIRGTWEAQMGPVVIIGFFVVIIGTLLGVRIFRNLKKRWFELGVYTIVGLNGLWIILSHWL